MKLGIQSIKLLPLVLLPLSYVATSATEPATSVQNYPEKAVGIVEPFGAGGGPDLLARALAPRLSKLWGQAVTVENITGSGATAAPAHVVKSPADGYTLLINTSAQAYSAAALNNLPYDPLKDFIPVIPLTRQPYVLVTGKKSGVKTVMELISLAKVHSSELKFGSTGIGTGTHIGAEKFTQAAAIKVSHLPPSPNDSVTDTLAKVIDGRIDYCLLPISLALPAIHDGKLIALGVTTKRRSTLLPEVPTIDEAGIAGFDFSIWYGIWVRAGTPSAVVAKLEKDIRKVLEDQNLRGWISEHGGELMNMTQTEFARFVLNESESASQILKAAAIRPK